MKNKDIKIKARFGPETRFEVQARPGAPFRALADTELERLKTELLREALQQISDPELNAPLRRAANEAAALAWATWYPLLLFPLLFQEKAETATRQTARQAEIRQRSLAYLKCLQP